MTALLPSVRKIWIWLAWLLIYFAAGKLGLSLAVVNASATPIWPPTGIAMALILLEGYAIWPLVLLGAFLVNVTTAGGLWPSLGIATGNALEAVLGAYLVNRFAGGSGVFLKAANVASFTGAAMVGTLASASIGVTVLEASHLANWSDYGAIWATWWLGDVTGAIIFAPFLLAWLSPTKEESVRRNPTEIILFILAFVLVAQIVFGPSSRFSQANTPTAFLWFPVLAWSGFRFGLRGTSALTVVLCPVAIWQTMHGLGPFARGDANASLLTAQAFTAVMVLTGLVIAGVVSERTQMERNLRAAQLSAEQQVQERTSDLTASNAILRRTQEDLRRLSTKLMRVQDEERRRVARDLHDSSGQLLAALSMELSKLKGETGRMSPQGTTAATEALRLVTEISTEIRTLSYLLHPPLLDELGLIAAVQWYAEGFAKRSSVRVELNLDESVERLPLEAETAAFRIIQECLTNVHMHSGSETARISLTRGSNKTVRIEVSDRGQGMRDTEFDKLGVGINGMRERMKMLGGELQIDSNKSGTTVIALIPFDVASKSAAR